MCQVIRLQSRPHFSTGRPGEALESQMEKKYQVLASLDEQFFLFTCFSMRRLSKSCFIDHD
jgi:hypothetical protein